MLSSILKRAIGPSGGQTCPESHSKSVYTATKIEFVDLEKKDCEAGREAHPLRRGRYELLLTTPQSKTYRTVVSKRELESFFHSARINLDSIPPPAPPKVADPSKIAKIMARSIFDSSGWPAIEVELTMEDGAKFCASIGVRYQREGQPKEESVERLKAIENVVERAVSYVNEKIGPSIVESSDLNSVIEQDKLDRHIAGKRKAKGRGKRPPSHASMALSMAICKAGAAIKRIPLHKHIASLTHLHDGEEKERDDSNDSTGDEAAAVLPVPVFSMINVARQHAPGGMSNISTTEPSLPGYELLLIPSGARSFKQALEVQVGADVYREMERIIKSSGTGEEGGFSPNKLYSNDGLTFLLDEAIRRAGHGDGACSFISSTNLSKKRFCTTPTVVDSTISRGEKSFTSQQLKGVRKKFVKECRVAVMLLGEWDTRAWHRVATYKYARNQRFTVQLLQTQSSVDDHLHHQNRGSGLKAKVSIGEKEEVEGASGSTDAPPNSVLLMPHPKGTISQLIKATKLCRELGWDVIFGNRTGGGTTEETFLADLTLGLGVRKIKAGAPAREKATVYNRLLRIDRELGEKAIYAG